MLAFVHIRKTGGSTVDMILRQSFGAGHCRIRLGKERAANPVAAAAEIRRCRWIYWKMKCLSGHGITPHSDLDSISKQLRFFTFLREPVTRCASDYQFRVVRGGLKQPFHEWVRTAYAGNQQTLKIAGRPDADAAIEILDSKVGFVGLLERFDESLVLLQRWAQPMGLDIRYQAKNVSGNSSIKTQLLTDPESLSLLREVNQEDLKLYRYVNEEMYPKRVSSFEGDLASAVEDFQRTNQPPAVYPRQIGSVMLREMIYKPLAPLLRNSENTTVPQMRAAS